MTKIVVSQAQLRFVPPADLVLNGQVRVDHNMQANQELINSVRIYGVMQPIVVRQVGGKLHIVQGHRRASAAKAAGLPSVPCLVEQVSDDEVTARQLVENIVREGLSLKDTAAGVRKLYAEHGVAALVSEMLGKSRAWVSKMLTLSAPGKSSLANRLLEDDLVHDLDLAYMLCQLEAKSYDDARSVYWTIRQGGKVTRDTLRDLLAKKDDQAGDGGEDEDDDQHDDTSTQPDAQLRAVMLSNAVRAWLADLVRSHISDLPAASISPVAREALASLSAGR